MQLKGYSLNIINKTIKDTLQSHNYEHKSKELQPSKIFTPYEKSVPEKLKTCVYNSLYKNKRLKRANTNKIKR